MNINYSGNGFGTFLIEVCRARYVSQRQILNCVKYLVETAKADVNVPSSQIISDSSSSKVAAAQRGSSSSTAATAGVYPLGIVAARGMPMVLRYMLENGGDVQRKMTGRFRLSGDARKSVHGTFTPLEFAVKMRDAERAVGVSEENLRTLDDCIKLLRNANCDIESGTTNGE